MRVVLVPVVLAVLTACSPRVTPIATLDAGQRDATMTLTGRVCTEPADPTSFRTVLIVVLDQSGSMCVTDPPGSTGMSGFCDSVTIPPNTTVPARVRALKQLLNELSQQPNVEVALIPYDSNVGLPVTGGAGDPQLLARIDQLQAQLGTASDLEGALARTYALIDTDVRAIELSAPETLPRTRYVVLVVSDGPPSPRCSVDDSLPAYADDTRPELTWADSTTYCNTATPGDPGGINGFVGGMPRNQNAHLFNLVDQMRALRTTHHVGDVQVNTTLLFNDESIADCGAICLDLWGPQQRWPGPVAVPSTQNPAYVKAAGQWLLRELATRGGGTFTEFIGRDRISNLAYEVDTRSLAARSVHKRLLALPLRAARFEGEWRSDRDGDGVIDEIEADAGTNPLELDTDEDGFDDRFELEHRDAGFEALVKDARGCDPAVPLTIGCTPRDHDGDGLSQYAEAYLGTSRHFADTDRDGFPDGLEVRFGLDPRIPLQPFTDSDGDGLTDAEELTRGSDPRRADRTFADELGIVITLDEEESRGDGSVCYRYTASNLPLAASSEASGYNLFKVWFASAPEGVSKDLGFWRTACAWGRKDGDVRVPENLTLDLSESAFINPIFVVDPYGDCAGVAP